MDSKKTTTHKRKNKYIPGVAALQFKPQFDWEIDQAKQLYSDSKFSLEVDKILYVDCITQMKQLPPESIDLIIADSPFGLNFSGKEAFYNREQELVVNDYYEIHEDYTKFSLNWIKELPRIMKPTASAYLFSGWTNLNAILSAIDNVGLTVINHIIWAYQFGVFTQRKFVSSHYHVLLVVKDPKNYFFNKIEHYPLDLWQIPRFYSPGEMKNGTKLPNEVVKRCLDFSSKPGDLIFDPFMGNGTTAVSAKQNFRHYLGYEINKNLQPIIDQNLASSQIGETYQPYKTYLPSINDLEEKYPQAAKMRASSQEAEKITQKAKISKTSPS